VLPPQAALDRHAHCRARGTPTLSILAGAIGLGIDTWRRWAKAGGRSTAHEGSVDPSAVATSWLAQLAARTSLTDTALTYAATRAGRDPAGLRATWPNKSRHDRIVFLDHALPGHDPHGLEAVCRHLLLADQPLQSLFRDTARADREPRWDRAIAALSEFVPADQLPGLLLSPTDPLPSDLGPWLDAAARLLTQWVDAAPALPAAVAVPAADCDRYLATAPESRAKALVREGLVPVVGLTAEAVRARLATDGTSVRPESVERLAADGASEGLAEAFCEAARHAAEPATAAEDDQARSAAERFLFERLESLPATAGLFQLNATPGVRRPGGRVVEIDLCAQTLRLAVEIDGYYHFRDPEAYRRDRRKDAILQQHGYFVLRVLAQDVVPRLE
jgi:hypothetical protein